MSELFPSESSSYAQEGTLAHALAESMLNGILRGADIASLERHLGFYEPLGA